MQMPDLSETVGSATFLVKLRFLTYVSVSADSLSAKTAAHYSDAQSFRNETDSIAKSEEQFLNSEEWNEVNPCEVCC